MQICQLHSRKPSVLVGGVQQRFCQQCGRFHLLGAPARLALRQGFPVPWQHCRCGLVHALMKLPCSGACMTPRAATQVQLP